MKRYIRMRLMGRQEKDRDRESYSDRRYRDYPQYPDSRYIGMGGDDDDSMRPYRRREYAAEPETRFRDRRGREHYDDGRYAPRSYGDEYDEPMERRGRMMPRRSEPTGRYDDWDYPMTEPVGHYDEDYHSEETRPQIGFSASGTVSRGGRTAKHFDRELAHRWMENLENSDGTMGPHWTMDQTKAVMTQHKIDADPLVFWVVINMIYSDDGAVAKEFGVNTIDYYAKMAKAFIEDKDALPIKERLAHYYEYIVKH